MVQSDDRSDQFSLFALGTALLRGWRLIVPCALGGALLAGAFVITKPKMYPATLAFVPQGTDAPESGLASVAGQLGLLRGGQSSEQPDFYVQLLQSRAILAPIALDTFVVAEEHGQRRTFFDLFQVGGPSDSRLERGVAKLQGSTSTSVVKNAGLVRVSVRTEWPSVSLRISQLLLDAVNKYNLQTRRTQAAAERQFVETALNEARDSLRAAEDRLQTFLATNRSGTETSPSLNSQWKRLEREAAAKTTIATTLEQQLAEARIREVRDTPTISVFESPAVSMIPDPRRRVSSVLIGTFAGAILGMALVLGTVAISRLRAADDPAANEFFDVLMHPKRAPLRRRPSLEDGQSGTNRFRTPSA